MTQSPPFPLLKHPAFQDLSDAALSRLQGSTKLLRFELGQQLCEPDDIPVSYTHLTLPTTVSV